MSFVQYFVEMLSPPGGIQPSDPASNLTVALRLRTTRNGPGIRYPGNILKLNPRHAIPCILNVGFLPKICAQQIRNFRQKLNHAAQF